MSHAVTPGLSGNLTVSSICVGCGGGGGSTDPEQYSVYGGKELIMGMPAPPCPVCEALQALASSMSVFGVGGGPFPGGGPGGGPPVMRV